MTGFSWQQLGAFTESLENLLSSGDKLEKFIAAGGRWVAPVLYNDVSAAANEARLPELRDRLAGRATVGIWANGIGSDPVADAKAIAHLVSSHGLGFIILDLESWYAYPNGDSLKMPKLVAAMRQQFPLGTKAIGVSTNTLNDAMVWNGRGADRLSFATHNVHVLPQWYVQYKSTWTDPVANMEWLSQHGFEDNFFAVETLDHRAVPAKYVHGTLEPTGVEGASLADGLARLKEAQAYGYTKGLSLYLLERTSDADLELVSKSGLFVS